MSDTITWLIGEGEHLEWWQMCVRTVIMFLAALVLIRISGRRAFGMGSPFDNVITILLGGILSRAVPNIVPIPHAVASGLVLVLLHRFVAWGCVHSKLVSKFFKGTAVVLFEQGKMKKDDMDKSLIAETDMMEELRLQGSITSFDKVDTAILERNGAISIIKKEE